MMVLRWLFPCDVLTSAPCRAAKYAAVSPAAPPPVMMTDGAAWQTVLKGLCRCGALKDGSCSLPGTGFLRANHCCLAYKLHK